MKRIYMTLALLGGMTFAATAQNIDLEAFISIVDGQAVQTTAAFSPDSLSYAGANATTDSVYGIWAIFNNGPEAILATDMIWYLSPYSRYLTEAEAEEEGVPFEDRYVWVNGMEFTDPVVAGEVAQAYSYSPVSEIGLLCDWDRWEQYGCDSGFVTVGPPHDAFEDGEEYGFFMRIYGMGTDLDNISNTDADDCNNKAAVRIIWNGAVSVADMIAPKEKVSLTVYPNPTTANLNFKYNFEKTSDVTVIVRDAVGRSVMVKNYGKMTAGNQDFQVDISSLDAGMYTIEMGTSYISALSKFTKL